MYQLKTLRILFGNMWNHSLHPDMKHTSCMLHRWLLRNLLYIGAYPPMPHTFYIEYKVHFQRLFYICLFHMQHISETDCALELEPAVGSEVKSLIGAPFPVPVPVPA